jgi:hypothetical protein
MLAAVAFAGPAGLLNTNWVGILTVVDADGNITSDNSTKATLTFTDENGELLAGKVSSPSLSFSFACLRDGRSLQMTGPNYLMSGEIFKGRYHKKGTLPTQTMTIQGSGLAEGIMFQGVLTQQLTP